MSFQKKNQNFGKVSYATVSLTASKKLKTFLMSLEVYNKMCQHSEDLFNSLYQYFLDEHMMLQNHTQVKRSIPNAG